jgi:hypothetical protein
MRNLAIYSTQKNNIINNVSKERFATETFFRIINSETYELGLNDTIYRKSKNREATRKFGFVYRMASSIDIYPKDTNYHIHYLCITDFWATNRIYLAIGNHLPYFLFGDIVIPSRLVSTIFKHMLYDAQNPEIANQKCNKILETQTTCYDGLCVIM